MELELTPDETSLLVGILVVWKTQIPHEKYEDLLIGGILEKMFAEDEQAVEKVFSLKLKEH